MVASTGLTLWLHLLAVASESHGLGDSDYELCWFRRAEAGLEMLADFGSHEGCENCGSAVLGEGKAQKALGWVPLGPCSYPHSYVEMEVLQGAETLLRFMPTTLLLWLSTPPVNRDPSPGTRIEVRLEVPVVRAPAVMAYLSIPRCLLSAFSAVERCDSIQAGYLRFEFCDPFLVPVQGLVKTGRTPDPVVPALLLSFCRPWAGAGASAESGGSGVGRAGRKMAPKCKGKTPGRAVK